MLDDDIVLKNCYYWAKRMMCRGVDFNALVSVGYIVGKPLRDARLLKDWIHFSMLKYIISEIESRKQCTSSLNRLHNKGAVAWESDDYINNIEYASKLTDFSDLHSSIKKAKLTNRETSCIDLVFFKGLTQQQAGDVIKIKQQTVGVYIQRALEKIRNTYLKGV